MQAPALKLELQRNPKSESEFPESPLNTKRRIARKKKNKAAKKSRRINRLNRQK